MAHDAGLSLQPFEVSDAAKQLDDLAARVETLIKQETPNLTVTAAGGDEVSVRVASTLNSVLAAFTKSTDGGTNEIREIAATLRAHTERVAAAEQDFAV